MLTYAIAYSLALNGWLFILMGLDKKKAQQRKWRIPEKRMLTLGLVGGGLGGLLGMYLFRHKTKELKFKVIYSLGVVVLVSVMFYFLVLN
ncbi:DUF1294 domain-containing protein [Carnobacterium sp. TMP28]|uniref:DUF1294 domain-containing protein n=1 Tax=Carnobacterium sp. TMP28 TaxID=3397060 RepID=UPI0039DF9347